MTTLQALMDAQVEAGPVPGAVALVARGDEVEVAVAGSTEPGGPVPLARDSIVRIASIGKPITAAVTMILVQDGLLRLTDTVDRWLPELAHPMVVRTPASPVEDVVPARRSITVEDLLTFRAGIGFPDDFTLPQVQLLVEDLKQGPPDPLFLPDPDAWMAILGGIPLLHQPGEAWLYNTCSDILGVLIARVCGQPLEAVMTERLFAPLRMVDTAFWTRPDKLDRFVPFYRTNAAGGLDLVDPVDGQWSQPTPFPLASGGLVSTLDDWWSFARALLGERPDLLTPESIRLMTTNYLTPAQRDGGRLFLEGQGWGFGGSVDVDALDPWNVPGRYGWVGGFGTAAHVVPSTGLVSILLTQVAMDSPTTPTIMRDFWTYAATR